MNNNLFSHFPEQAGMQPTRKNNIRSNHYWLVLVQLCTFHIHKNTDMHLWACFLLFYARIQGRWLLILMLVSFWLLFSNGCLKTCFFNGFYDLLQTDLFRIIFYNCHIREFYFIFNDAFLFRKGFVNVIGTVTAGHSFDVKFHGFVLSF